MVNIKDYKYKGVSETNFFELNDGRILTSKKAKKEELNGLDTNSQ